MSELEVIERLDAGLATIGDISQEIIARAYNGMQSFCRIPEAYHHCEIGSASVDFEKLSERELNALLLNPPRIIINPSATHLKAIEFFRMLISGSEIVCDEGDPLRPNIGAYLTGPPGVGKTHVMAAYSLAVKEELDSVLKHLFAEVKNSVSGAYETYSKKDLGGNMLRFEAKGLAKILSPREEFNEKMNKIQKRVETAQYKPTDLLYLPFSDLFDLYRSEKNRDVALGVIREAKIVFIDDVNPQEDPLRLEVIQEVIEGRYSSGRFGTFITSNISSGEFGKETIKARLASRCRELFVNFDFKDCTDWRERVKSKRVRKIEEILESRCKDKTSDGEYSVE